MSKSQNHGGNAKKKKKEKKISRNQAKVLTKRGRTKKTKTMKMGEEGKSGGSRVVTMNR